MLTTGIIYEKIKIWRAKNKIFKPQGAKRYLI